MPTGVYKRSYPIPGGFKPGSEIGKDFWIQKKHGHAGDGIHGGTRTYRSWSAMRRRCYNQRAENYSLYGGRGIKVCEQWRNFENFLNDMGERPVGTSIDRIDPNGNYEPANCRWATPMQQRHNQRRCN